MRIYLPLALIAVFTYYVCSYLSGLINNELLGLCVVFATSTLLISVSSLTFVIDTHVRLKMWHFAKRKLGIGGVTNTN